MTIHPATLNGFKLYAISRKFGSELLYRIEGKKGLYYKEFDAEGEETLRPLRNGRWIYDAQAHKMPYVKDRW